MKKRLGIWLIVLLLAGLMGCESAGDRVWHQYTKELVLDLIDAFGDPQTRDLEWTDDCETIVMGSGDTVFAAEDEAIMLIMTKDEKTMIMKLVLSESDRHKVLVWNVMLTYVDISRQIYIELDCYHWDYADETIDMDFEDFAERLGLLNLQDIEWILSELDCLDLEE